MQLYFNLIVYVKLDVLKAKPEMVMRQDRPHPQTFSF